MFIILYTIFAKCYVSCLPKYTDYDKLRIIYQPETNTKTEAQVNPSILTRTLYCIYMFETMGIINLSWLLKMTVFIE